MCTVTYIPLKDHGFILTHNRDESIRRKIATPPIARQINGMEHIFPVDTQGMGTWIGVSASGRAASLLNGGSVPHLQAPAYRHSRGLVIPDYFSYPGFIEFFNDYDFSGLEPFTLLVFEEGRIFETVLDEGQVQFRIVNSNNPLIYSSTTLYSPEARERRKNHFQEWYLSGNLWDQQGLLKFHNLHLYENEPVPLVLPEGHILKTVSMTSISMNQHDFDIGYHDLLNDIHFKQSRRIIKKIIQKV